MKIPLTIYVIIGTWSLSAVASPQSTDWTHEKWVKSPEWLKDSVSKVKSAHSKSHLELLQFRDNAKRKALNTGPGLHQPAFEWLVSEYYVYKTIPEKSGRNSIIECLKYADSCGGFLAEEYAYWRFLLEVEVSRSSQAAEVGLRLSESRPSDILLFVETINTLKYQSVQRYHSSASQLISNRKSAFENDYRYHGAVGDFYYTAYLRKDSHTANDRENFRKLGIDHLTRYLASPNVKPPYRSVFERRLNTLKEG